MGLFTDDPRDDLIGIDDVIRWYKTAKPELRWRFIDAVGGYAVSAETAYIHPNKDYDGDK